VVLTHRRTAITGDHEWKKCRSCHNHVKDCCWQSVLAALYHSGNIAAVRVVNVSLGYSADILINPLYNTLLLCHCRTAINQPMSSRRGRSNFALELRV